MVQGGKMQGSHKSLPDAKHGGNKSAVSNLQLECDGNILNECPQTSNGMAKYIGVSTTLLHKIGIFSRSSAGLNPKWEYLKDIDPNYEPRHVTRTLDISQKADAEQLRGRRVRITCTMPDRWGEPSQGNAKRARTT